MPQGKKVYELKNKEEGFLIPLSGFFRITTTLFSWSDDWFWKQEARHWLYVGQRTVETRADQLMIGAVLNLTVAHTGGKRVMEEQLPQGESMG